MYSFLPILIIMLDLLYCFPQNLLMEDRNDVTHMNPPPGQMNAQSTQMVLQEITKLEEYLDSNPTNIKVVLRLGKIYEKISQFQKAIELYEPYVEQGNKNAQILLSLGFAYFAANQTFYAQKCWNQVVSFSQNKLQSCIGLAKQLLALNATNPKAASFALKYALQSLQINSKQKEAWKVFVNTLQSVFLTHMNLNICKVLLWTFSVCTQTLETQIFQKARIIYENVLQLQKRFEILANLGFLCQVLDKHKQAIKYYREAETINNTNIELYEFMAVSYCELKDFKNVKACIQKFPRSEKTQLKQEIIDKYWKNQVSMSYKQRYLRHLYSPTGFGKQPNKPLQEQQYRMIHPQDNQTQSNLHQREQNNRPVSRLRNISQNQKKIITKTDADAKILTSKVINVQKEYQYPYSAIGILRGRISKDYEKPIIIEGTAFIIGPNIIMTAAHNIYSHYYKRQCKDLCFYPAGFDKIGQGYSAKTVFFPLEYRNLNSGLNEIQQKYLLDYALIELDTTENLQDFYGSLGYSFDTIWNQNKNIIQQAQIIGKNPGRTSSDLLQLQGNALIDTYYLIHKMPTVSGFSGAPVLQKVKNSYFVRGIHVKNINRIIENGKAALKLDMKQFQMFKKFHHDLHEYDLSNVDQDTKIISDQDLKVIVPAIAENQKKNSNGKDSQNHRIMLSFWLHNIGPEGCKYLRAPQLKNLQILNLAANMIGPEGCEQLALNEWIYLRQIYLQGNKIKAEGCKYLAGANWPELRMIYLRCNEIQSEGCKYLAQNKWTKLQKIFLNENNIQDEGCRYLAEAEWNNLQIIWLHKNDISTKGCEYLSTAKWRDLQQIYLDDNHIGEEGSRHLAKALWNNLRLLYLFQTSIGSIGFLHLSTAKWDKLERLYLQRNKISDQGCKNLSKLQWINLRVLHVQMNEIGSEGCRYLVQAKLPRLQCLSLHQNYIGPEGCNYLAQAKWPNLTSLTLYANPIGREGYKCFSNIKWNVYCEYRFQQEQSEI